MKTLKNLAFAVLCCGILPAAVADTEHPIYTSTWTGTVSAHDTFPWTNESGETVPWVNDGTVKAVLKGVNNGNFGLYVPFSMYGLRLDYSGCKGAWYDGSSAFTLGAGGVEFMNGANLSCGKSTSTAVSVYLAADQTWRVLDDKTSTFALGTDHYTASPTQYTRNRLVANDGVTKWTLTGPLNFWVLSSNNLAAVDIRCEDGAQMFLEKTFFRESKWWTCEPGWCAKSIAFQGDGVRYWAGGKTPIMPLSGVNTTLEGEMSPRTLGGELILEDGADVQCEDAVLSIPKITVTGGDSAFTGSLTVDLDELAVDVGEDASLTFGNISVAEGRELAVSVDGAGTLAVPSDFAGSVSLGDEATLRLSGAGRLNLPFEGGAALEFSVPAGQFLYAQPSVFANFTGSLITVKSGTLLLDEEVPGVTVVEDGGSCVLASSGLYITDVVRTDVSLTVPAGKTLEVLGNGLTAATELTLDGGDIRFCVNGTKIKSPIQLLKPANVLTLSASVTGEVAGAVNYDIPLGTTKGLRTFGDGCVVFSGGATSKLPATNWWDFIEQDSTRFGVYGGSAVLKGGTYDFGAGRITVGVTNTSAKVKDGADFGGRHLLICDGGIVKFADRGNGLGSSYPAINIQPVVDDNEYVRGKVTLEIGEGGSLTIPWNRNIHAGNSQNCCEIVLSGGTMTAYRFGYLHLGYGTFTTCDLVMKSGTLVLNKPLRHNAATCVTRLLWYGGTIRLGKDYLDATTLFAVNANSPVALGGNMKCTCQILGDGCVLDLGDYPKNSFTNTPAGYNRAEWIGTGKLTVRGGKTCRELVMNEFPSGVRLALENGAKVTVPEDARVYDPVKSDYKWVRIYPESNFYPTDPWLTDNSLTLSEYIVSDAVGGTFSYGKEGAVKTAETLRVGPEGVWDNAKLAGLGVAVSNAVFESGATWSATTGETLALPGTLVLPDAIKCAVQRGVPHHVDLATAAQGVAGEPDWTFTARRYGATVNIGSVMLDGIGLQLLVR